MWFHSIDLLVKHKVNLTFFLIHFEQLIGDIIGKKSQIFIFTLLCGASQNSFMKVLKASQRSVKKKNLTFISTQLSEMQGTGRVNVKQISGRMIVLGLKVLKSIHSPLPTV